MSTESKKARLREQREQGKCEVDDFCHEHGFSFEFITDYHIRIENQLDVFPTNRKFCVVKTQRWGMYNFISELLKHLKKDDQEKDPRRPS
jgi:hypothetical protein